LFCVHTPLKPIVPKSLTHRSLWVILLALTMLLYAPTLTFSFVHDDWTQVVGNHRIQSWEYFPSYFTEHVWAHLFGVEQANYYRPLFLLWTLLNHTLFGLNPVGWHLTTVVAHLAAGSLLYLVARELLHDDRAALVAAAVFLVHPVQVESVAWIAAVTEPLLGITVLGGLLAWIRASQYEGWRRLAWLAAASAAYLAGLMVKESAIVLPAVVLLYECTLGTARTRRELPKAALRVAAVFGPAVAVYYPLRMAALHGGLQASMKAPLPSVLLTLPSLVAEYAKHVVAPVGLAMNYETPYLHAPGPQFWWPLFIVIAMAGMAVLAALRSRVAAFALGSIPVFLFLPLAASGLFAYGDLVHDRYLYLPIACVGLLGGALWNTPWTAQRSRLRAIATAAVIAGLAVLTLIYSQHWKDNLSLYRRSATISPNMMLPKVLVATQLFQRGELAESKRLLDEARAISNDHWLVLITVAQWHDKARQPEKAEGFWMRSITQQPRYPLHYFGLAETRLAMGQPRRAIEPLRQAVELVPSNVHYRLRLASVLQETGDVQGALHELREVLRRRPGEDHLRAHIARLEQQAAESP
jgi:tetratricopeptide (TPR) repeat protein